MNIRASKHTAIAALIAVPPAANWMIGHVGTVCVERGPCLIPVGFGLTAPSGVLLIGVGLVLRDVVQDGMGARWSLAAICVGSVLSFLTAPPLLAVASATAILLAELADFSVYTPLRRRGKWLAVLLSGAVGAVADSLIFTNLAFGSASFAAGLILGKFYTSAAYSAWLAWRRA